MKVMSLFFFFYLSQIALKRFTSEEVGAWSTLRSPHVLELFGVVREGPNVLLLMDHKSGNFLFFFYYKQLSPNGSLYKLDKLLAMLIIPFCCHLFKCVLNMNTS